MGGFWKHGTSIIEHHSHRHRSSDITLTHWGRVKHICVSKLTIIGPDNGLSPGRRQTITWSKADILLFGPLETNFSQILSEIYTFSFKKMSSSKWCQLCLGLKVLICKIGFLWSGWKKISSSIVDPSVPIVLITRSKYAKYAELQDWNWLHNNQQIVC